MPPPPPATSWPPPWPPASDRYRFGGDPRPSQWVSPSGRSEPSLPRIQSLMDRRWLPRGEERAWGGSVSVDGRACATPALPAARGTSPLGSLPRWPGNATVFLGDGARRRHPPPRFLRSVTDAAGSEARPDARVGPAVQWPPPPPPPPPQQQPRPPSTGSLWRSLEPPVSAAWPASGGRKRRREDLDEDEDENEGRETARGDRGLRSKRTAASEASEASEARDVRLWLGSAPGGGPGGRPSPRSRAPPVSPPRTPPRWLWRPVDRPHEAAVAKLLLRPREFLRATRVVRTARDEIDWVATFLRVGFARRGLFAGVCPRRKGRWKAEEERYALELLRLLADGTLRLRAGQTVRGFVGRRLHSDDTRVLKKLSNCARFRFARAIQPTLRPDRRGLDADADGGADGSDDDEAGAARAEARAPGGAAALARLAELKRDFLRAVQLEALVAVRACMSDEALRALLLAAPPAREAAARGTREAAASWSSWDLP